MKIEKIKPIPKYILARIKKADKQNNVTLPHQTRFYAYLTKNDGELVKVTVAVKYRYKKWLYKQVAVHGVHSDVFMGSFYCGNVTRVLNNANCAFTANTSLSLLGSAFYTKEQEKKCQTGQMEC